MPDAIDQKQALPAGTVTFMFTDVEGSTNLVRRLGDEAFGRLLERHHELIRGVLTRHGGIEVATEGDSFFSVFSEAPKAVAAATDIQHGMAGEEWDSGVEVKVRIGLHTGNASLGGDNYTGVDVHRASRIAEAGHGGQVLLSDVTGHLVADRLPEGVSLINLGRVRLEDLPDAESLSQLCIDGLPQWFAPPRGAAALSKLPSHLTEFVGRKEDLEHGAAMLREHRLVTLTGPGGTGKTRLSIELARKLEPEFADGCFFVPLSTIRDPELIAPTVLGVLGLTTAANVDPLEHLHRYLQGRQSLLVLDNFEQLIKGAPLVAGLLQEAPDLKILVTSRAPLRVAGERELPVPPLPVPAGGEVSLGDVDRWAGVQLFARRASAVRPDFELGQGNVGVVTAIASRLDGLPLAIELAASRMRTLTPELILQRLDNRLLSSTGSDVPARQQTIVEAIGWSYDLLDNTTRRMFECCAVFSGSFALTDAEIVCQLEDETVDVLDGLIALVENSLLQQTETSGEPRFRMLTVIREYGYAALSARGEEQEMLERHARAYLDLAERADSEILTSAQGEWLSRLAADHDNLRSAIDWAINVGDATLAQRLVGALWRFWQIRGHLREGRQRAETALTLQGGDPWARARALTALAGIEYWQGEWERTLEPYSEALALYREHGTEAEVAEALYNLSFPHAWGGEHDRAEELIKESLAISKRIDRRIGVGRALWALGDIASFKDDWDSLVELSLQAAAEFEELDAPYDLGWAWFMAAFGHLRKDESDEAKSYLLRAMRVFADVEDLSALTLLFENSGVVALRSDDGVRAAKLAGAAHRLKEDTGVTISEVSVNQFPEFMDFMATGDEAVKAAFEEGRSLSLQHAIEVAEAACSSE